MTPRTPPHALLPWALAQLDVPSAGPDIALHSVAGDASNRRYFRFYCAGGSYIAAEAPPATEKNAAFLAVAKLLAEAGIRVPAVLGADLQRGYLLLEDLGDRPLQPALGSATADDYYRQAFAVLERLTALDTAHLELGGYDRALLEEELARFGEWFLAGLLGYTPASAEQTLLDALCERLVASALAQPQVLVHRDFHSRNLMLVEDDRLAVIDFQDAVVGPVTYDLVSLLRDCYVQWPPGQVAAWALDYRRRLLARGRLHAVSEEAFMRWFDWMGLQRHLKVLGTFARLSLRDQKPAYLADLPLVIHYVREIAEKYAQEEPLFAEFSRWFAARVQPLIARQDWSRTS